MSARILTQLARRRLGNTGEELSVIALGGIVVMDETPEHAANVVAEAVDAGVNYFDVAPSYGNAEQRLGPALEPYRRNSFLACKTAERDAAGARRELEQSLRNMRTDYFDLYQLHSIETPQDVEVAFGPGGAMETFVAARQEGKVRFLGFSAHSQEAALEAIRRFDFDSVLLPLNWVAWYAGGYGQRVVEAAQAKGMGILALKSLARSLVPEGQDQPYAKCWYVPHDRQEDVDLCVRFTLGLPVTAAVPPGEEALWRMAVRAATSGLSPLSEDELGMLQARAAGLEPVMRTPSDKWS
jgi:aryl-alcohol dehydrogenase-like predicted oxidoreductase